MEKLQSHSQSASSLKKQVSIIVPVFNEEKNVTKLIERLIHHTARLSSYEFTFIFVDDGSEDNSVAAIRKIMPGEPRIKLVQLSRNFGKEAAVSAGIKLAHGDAAIIIDADMQMPPKHLGEFLQKWEAGAEVVVGVFIERNMSWLRSTCARIFYAIMQKIGHVKIMPHATDYRLLDKKVIAEFNAMSEHNRMTRGLIDWLGFKRDYVYYRQAPRKYGQPTYSFKKLVGLAINSFTSFSLLPLKISGYIGMFILVVSLPLGIALYAEHYVLKSPMHWTTNGTTMLAVLNLFLVGVTLVCLGLIALYIARIHAEVTNRPLYVIRKIHDVNTDEELQ